MNVKLMKLSEICSDIIDCPHSTPEWKEHGVRVIRNFNIIDGHLDFADGYYVDEDTYAERTKRAIPQYRNIVFSREAPIGKCALIPKDFKGCLGQRLVLLIVNESVCSPEYVLIALQSEYVQQQIRRVENTGSIVSNFNISDLKNLVIPIMDTSDSIVDIINPINDKIKLNKSICFDLESLAKEIYDYWFVQFDFPDENGKPYRSSGGKMVWSEELNREIPEGWEVKSLDEIVNESDKSKVQVNGAKEVGVYPFFTSGSTVLALDNYFVDGFHCFLSTGGFPEVKGYKGKCAYSTDTWCIDADIYSYVLYQFLMSIKGQMETLLFAGTGLKHLQKDKFKSLCIVTPPSDLMVKFNATMDSIWDKKTVILTENKDLTKLRDFLLPMLMNGQIKIGVK